MFLAALLLAACGGAVYTPPAQVIYVTVPVPLPTSAVVHQVGPDEAGQIIFDATSTARAVATQQAAGAATDAAARAAATMARAATVDALAGLQTQSALQLTQGAGQALATNAASIHTADADQTAAAGTPTAAALRVAVAATGTQLARQAETAVRRQALDDQIAAARGWLLLGLLGLGLLLVMLALTFGIWRILDALAEIKRAEARRAEALAAQLWIMHYGGRLLQLRGDNVWEEMQTPQISAPALVNPEPVATNIREVPVRAHGEVVGMIDLAVQETPERLRVLHLLTLAISIAGPGAGFVPSADRLGMHRQEWQTALDSLKAGPDRKAYVMTSPGRPKVGQAGRTRLCQPDYMTLGALRDGITRGDVLPLPPAPVPVPVA